MACAPPPEASEYPPLPRAPVPGQQAALDTILATWGVERLPFQLEWVTGEALDCDYGRRFIAPDGGCWAGVTLLTPGQTPVIRLAWTPGTRYADTMMAHELCHLHFYDEHHEGPCAYSADSLVGQATKALETP